MIFSNISWIKKIEVESFQIYFAASLELQEELISHKYNVPRSKDGKIKTPIPIIYANFKGWIKQREPITIERLIPPEWLGIHSNELMWKEIMYRGRKAYIIPDEKVYVNIGLDSVGNIIFSFDVENYHLERTSIRGVNPEKWNNWVMFYISIEDGEELLSILNNIKAAKPVKYSMDIAREDLQGGKEITYYSYIAGKKDIGIPVKYYSFCLGCFPLAMKYLLVKAKENGLDPSIVSDLRLRIELDPYINTGLKVGVAKVFGKHPQIMFKLASNTPKTIRGILKPIIKGKARGKLVKCDHLINLQYIIVEGTLLYQALVKAMQYLDKLPMNKNMKESYMDHDHS